MNFLERLQTNMKSESEAYGYTLSVCGSGALLLQGFNLQASHIFLFVLGGVIGFGLLAYTAFRGLKKSVPSDTSEDIITGSMIHILSALGTVLISYTVISLSSGLQLSIIAGIIGFNTTFSYNVLLLLEGLVYKDLFEFEDKLIKAKS
mgnify:CR=1 FL=1